MTHAGEPRGAGNESSRGLRTCCFLLKLNVIHEVLEFAAFFFCDGWLIVVIVVIFKYLREHIGNRLSFWVAHGEHGGVGTFGHQLMLQPVALAVTHDDEVNLPQPQVIQKLVTVVAYLAHD